MPATVVELVPLDEPFVRQEAGVDYVVRHNIADIAQKETTGESRPNEPAKRADAANAEQRQQRMGEACRRSAFSI